MLHGRFIKTKHFFAIFLLLFLGCSSNSKNTTISSDALLTVKDLEVVDCLLPGQVRRLGATTFLSQRQPIKTIASDCRIRGGEYVEFDQANYSTALKVWMPEAQAGNANAQANVGEIFERGLGGEANYEAAALWYLKSAKLGNTRAQYNLGALYEQGLGVDKNKIEALNWYRKAWGMEEDSLVFKSVANKQIEDLRSSLNNELKNKASRIGFLTKQITSLEKEYESSQSTQELNNEIEQLKSWVNKLESERKSKKQEIAKLPKYREPKPLDDTNLFSSKSSIGKAKDSKYGRYFALVIGNQKYQQMENLDSPVNDASRAAKILEERYGFNVELLINANNLQIMMALNQLNGVLSENDNLLIFYAGHGNRIVNGNWESGYWLPINADLPPNDSRWVANESITRHLSRIKAKRVLVVADSCYSGLLSSAPSFVFAGSNISKTEAYLSYVLPKKSRLLLTSGGDHPVLDNFGNGHSIFAKVLLDELENNNGVLASSDLFTLIRERVSKAANNLGLEQRPEFKPIKGAGHAAGAFLFVPTT